MKLANQRQPLQGAARVTRTPAGVLLLLGLACLVGAPAHGQLIPGIGIQAPQQAELSDQQQSEAAAIPVEHIPGRLEQARELARRAQDTARALPELAVLEKRAEELDTEMEWLRGRALAGTLARSDLRSLEDALDHAAGLARRINAMQATMGRRAGELSDWRSLLSHSLQSWTLTGEAARQRGVPDGVLENISNAQALLRKADDLLKERQDEVLALQSQLTDRLAAVDAGRSVIRLEISHARVELFQPEHPPIWNIDPAPATLAASSKVWQEDWSSLRRYMSARQDRAWAHLGLLVLLLGAFASLAGRIKRWTQDKPDLAHSLAVFHHPLAAALLLAIFSWPWFYPDAPVVLRELFGVLLILPLLRVLPQIVAPSMQNALYIVAALFLLLRLNGLLGVGTALERYSLLLLTATAAAAVAWIFRRGGPAAALEAGRWWQAARLAARVAQLLLAAALLANLAGLVSLSGLLTNGVISSTFAAIVLFAGVIVTRAMIIALFQTRLLQHLNLVRWHAASVDHWLMRILALLALIGWLAATARLFRVDEIVGNVLSSILFSSATIGTVEISLGDILAFTLAIWLGLLVSRMLRFVLSVDVYPRVSLPRGVPATISMLVNYVIIGIAVVFAVAAAGIQLDRFAIIVGALSVGIGFGLQNIVNNFVSGLILAFERPVQSGDTVEFSSMFGRVSRIGVRSSTVRTFDGAEVIVPNANLISNEVTNWTLSDQRRRMEILVGVAYGTNPHKVLELLLAVARRDDRLLAEPAPAALFLGFGDSSLDFSLRAWTDEFDNYLGIKSDLTLAVHDALYAADIEIPFPQRDLHLRSVDASAVSRIGAVQSPPVGEDGSAETSPSPSPAS